MSIDIASLLGDGEHVVVLDTNVLLGIYHYSPNFTEFSLECLRKIEANVWLPATVHLEYQEHRHAEFSKMEGRVSEMSNNVQRQIDLSKKRVLSACDLLGHLQYPGIVELYDMLEKDIDSISARVDEFFTDRPALDFTARAWARVDRLKQYVCQIQDDGRVMDAPTQQEIYRWCREGERRYEKQKPPGFKDAKKKKGVRAYSDLILWKEVLGFAKERAKDVVFVTDDAKEDWWETDSKGTRSFHGKLVEEFGNKTGRQILAMTSLEFYAAVSSAFEVERTDIVEIALGMTDDDYCEKIADDAFDEISHELRYYASDYIDDSTAHVGTEGIEEFEVDFHRLVSTRRVERDDEGAKYRLTFQVKVSGISHNYWGRDDDTHEIIASPDIEHEFAGEIVIEVMCDAGLFSDFEGASWFEGARIVRGSLVETRYRDLFEEEGWGEFGNCPECGCPLDTWNDAGNGFCIDCS